MGVRMPHHKLQGLWKAVASVAQPEPLQKLVRRADAGRPALAEALKTDQGAQIKEHRLGPPVERVE